ncbi:MAG: MoaD/ThiS family protein [Chloroflexota bacterium]|nr:MoaD/ThiS family protein [Chloroflexota bacterium]
MATVLLPRTLMDLFPAAAQRVDVDARSVGDVIERLDAVFPGMRNRLLDAGPRLRRHLLIFVDQERATLDTVVAPRSEVRIVPALSGG